MKRSTRRFAAISVILSLVAAVAGGWATTARATNYTWTGAASGATWDTTATNWSGGTDPWDITNGPGNTAVFNPTGVLTLSVTGNVYANGIYEQPGNSANKTTIDNTGGGTIHLYGSGTANPVLYGATGGNPSDWTLTISAPIVLEAPLGSSVYIGQTNTTGTNGSCTINGGLTSTNSLNLYFVNSHPLNIATNSLNITGAIYNQKPTGTATISANIGSNVTSVTQNGAATMILSGINSYTGPTNIMAGMLTISDASTFTNTSAINLTGAGRLDVNVLNQSLAKLSGVPAGTTLRYSKAQTTGGTGPGTILGTVELNVTNVNPNYTLDFGQGSKLANTVAATYNSPITLSGDASIDTAGNVFTGTSMTVGSSNGLTKTLTLTGTSTGANTIGGAISNTTGTISLLKTGTGTWNLSGTNTYTGATTVTAGTLGFAKRVSLYNNGAAGAWSAGNIIVMSNSTLALRVGGAGEFTDANVAALAGLGTASGGFMNGSTLALDTTGGSFTCDSVIANPNGGANVLGLTKLGTNTLTLSKANTYTGLTTISAGTLQLGTGVAGGNGSVASSAIVNNAALIFNDANDQAYSGIIRGTGTLTKQGAGNLTLSGVNTFTGATTVSAGTLTLTNNLALRNSALTTSTAGVTLSGVTTPTFGGLNGSTALASAITGYGSVTALTLNPLSGTATYGGVIANGDGNMPLIKTGAGTQALNGAAVNTFTGGLVIRAGTLVENFANLGDPTNLINSANVLTLGGGTLSLTAKSNVASSQTFASTSLDANTASKITLTKTGTGTMSVDLKAITRNGRGLLNFSVVPDTTNVFALSTNANTNGILGPWATVGATTTLQYAANNGSNQIVALGAAGTTAATPATDPNLANMTDAATNYSYSAAATLDGNQTGNTLRYTGAATTTALGTKSLTLNGLMNAGTNTLTITNTAGSPGLVIGDSGELDIISNDKNIAISSVISGTGALVYSGGTSGATLTLSGVNTYSGGTIVASGTLALTNATNVLGTGPVTLMPGTILGINNAVLSNSITITDASIASGNSFGSTINGPITLGGVVTLALTGEGNSAITGNISGSGALTQNGLRIDTLTYLSGTNTYTGPTTIASSGTTYGALKFTNRVSLYNADTGSWTADKIIVNPVAVAVFAVGGAGQFTSSDIETLAALGSNTGGFMNGSFIGLDTTSASYACSSVIGNPNGGANMLGVNKFGNNTLTLSGASTYTGQTRIYRGALSVSSINSVVGGTATSNLGAPKTVADGTIIMGLYGQIGTLTYTGSGETTDRVIALNNAGGGGGSGGATIDQSGSGLLKFTSDLSVGTLTGKTITFQGSSTTGTGEFAGAITGIGQANNVVKSGTGTWTLSGANVYSGTTKINAGTLRVSSINSVAGGAAFSSLGAPTTVANGTIAMGSSGNTGRLLYTGAGETTDRVINLAGTTGGAIIDQSGAGLLKFTSDMTATGNGNKTLTLQGSNPAGTGEIAGAIVNYSGTSKTSVIKAGTGTWTLSGANTYTGTTGVNEGRLVVNHASGLGGAGGGAVTVVADATLALSGPVNQISTGALTMQAGAIYEWALGGSSADVVDVTGNLTLDDGWKLFLVDAGGGAPQPGTHYTLLTYSGNYLSSTWIFDSSNIDAGGTDWTVSGASIVVNAGEVYITGLSSVLPGDTNGDGVVDTADYIAVKRNLGLTTGASLGQGNVDGDGDVDWDDLQMVMTNFGTGASTAPATTPEPCSAMLLVLGAMAVVRRRARIGRISR